MKSKYPPGWNQDRVKRLLEHYEQQTEEEAIAEDEASFEDKDCSYIEIPNKLIPSVRELIAKHNS